MKSGFFFTFAMGLLLLTGCTKDSKKMVQEFSVDVNTKNSIPMVMGRTETGTVTMKLYDDNSLEFKITANNMASADTLTAAHIHTGDLVSTGPVSIALVDGSDIKFSGNTAEGTLTLTAAQVTTLKGNGIYVNIHSTQVAAGLLRGQVGQKIDAAYGSTLSPTNQVPPVTGRSEDGTACFRLVGTTLHYRVNVNNLAASDTISGGHIHMGTSTGVGSVFLNLGITSNAETDVAKTMTLTAAEITKLGADQLYVNIHSTQVPAGLLRGQVSNQ